MLPSQIRAEFNRRGLREQADAGALHTVVVDSALATIRRCERLGMPLGTLSQLVEYYDGDVSIALAHRYLKPDGTLGASGKPDPKRLTVGDEVWVVPDKA